MTICPIKWDKVGVTQKQRLALGKKLRRCREQKGLTIRQLADASGIYKSSLHRMETGIQEPRLSELEMLVKALDTSVMDLYGGGRS